MATASDIPVLTAPMPLVVAPTPPVSSPLAHLATLADLQDHLGGIDPARIRLFPSPGYATEQDALRLCETKEALCELIDGALVEKVMGFPESVLAFAIGSALRAFVMPRKLGIVAGIDGMLRLFPGMVRIPDVAFASWNRLPGRRMPAEALPSIVPDLAVEVISAGNTRAEMDRKLREYLSAGVAAVWFVYPSDRTIVVHAPPAAAITLRENELLRGTGALTGFSLSLGDLFAELDATG